MNADPRSRPSAAEHEPQAAGAVPSCAAILIVEDEETFARNLATYLERHGYETRIAGSIEQALDELGRLLQTNPDNAEAHLLRGRIYERSGDYAKAIEALKSATFWDPKSVGAYVSLARIYVFRNDCPNAQAAMRKALQLDPTSEQVLAIKRTVDNKCGQ